MVRGIGLRLFSTVVREIKTFDRGFLKLRIFLGVGFLCRVVSEISFKMSAIAQIYSIACEALRNDPEGSKFQLPDVLAKPKVSVRDILCSEIPLPFMPDLIDYKIGKGCCGEIVKREGLFTPCSAPCDGPTCAKHLKESTGCGDYEARLAAWDAKELYCVVINEKEIKEKTYGAYLHGKKLDSSAVKEELDKWGIAIQLDATLFRPPAKPVKKNRGRKPERKVESTESDSEDLAEADLVETGVVGSTETEKVEVEQGEAEKEPEKEPEKVEKAKKKKKEKVVGTSLDAKVDGKELVKEEMEEKPPKKGKFRGKKDTLTEVTHEDIVYLTKDGRYYAPETLELVAWTRQGEFTMLEAKAKAKEEEEA